MVFFTCDACGSSLKKNQVEKHYNSQCRRCSVLTCMDCQKEFPGDSYRSHTSCISENEKYGGKGWQPKANANKGLKKQNEWIESIQAAVEENSNTMDKDVKSLLDGIMTFDNIPRKKPKFVNFVKNVIGGGKRCSPATIEKTWSIFESALKKTKNDDKPYDGNTSKEGKVSTPLENISTNSVDLKSEKLPNLSPKAISQETTQERLNGHTDQSNETNTINQGVKMFCGTKRVRSRDKSKELEISIEGIKKSKKLKTDSESKSKCNEDVSKDTNSTLSESKFKWEKEIRAILSKNTENGLKIKTIKKKLLKRYLAEINIGIEDNEKLDTKISKKLSKLQNKFQMSPDGKRLSIKAM